MKCELETWSCMSMYLYKHSMYFSASTYLVHTIFPDVLGTYWYVLCLQKYCSGCCFVSYACGKRYYVCVNVCCGAPIMNQCPYRCPTYMTLVWYVISMHWYVPVCTSLHFLYRSVLGTYQYEPVPNRYILNTLFL